MFGLSVLVSRVLLRKEKFLEEMCDEFENGYKFILRYLWFIAPWD